MLARKESRNIFSTRRRPILISCSLDMLAGIVVVNLGYAHCHTSSIYFCAFHLQGIFPESDIFSCLPYSHLLWAHAPQICQWEKSPGVFIKYELLSSTSNLLNLNFKGWISAMCVSQRTQGGLTRQVWEMHKATVNFLVWVVAESSSWFPAIQLRSSQWWEEHRIRAVGTLTHEGREWTMFSNSWSISILKSVRAHLWFPWLGLSLPP